MSDVLLSCPCPALQANEAHGSWGTQYPCDQVLGAFGTERMTKMLEGLYAEEGEVEGGPAAGHQKPDDGYASVKLLAVASVI
jgi:hypothetical protein